VRAHERRLLASTLRETTIRYAAYSNDRAVAAGQTVVEGDLAGLYDIVTATDARGQGLGTGISRWLLAAAEERGAGTAYLQVDAGNAAARSIYAKLGFVDRYAYWYRRPAGVVGELQI
jgi:GNAT superfamily N-acetyltransferase